MMNYLKQPRILVLLSIFVFTGCAGVEVMDPGVLSSLLGQALSHQVTQFTFAFSLAAFIHSGRVKKEIREQFSGLVDSIDKVRAALNQDLAAQNQRLAGVEVGMTKLAGRVDQLENLNADKAQPKG